MKVLTWTLLLAMVAAGCATTSASRAPAAQTYTGEVWTWDEQANTVTLRQGSQIIRVNVAPEQLRGLQLHQVATVRGTLAPPAELATVVVPPGAIVPRGSAESLEVSGTVKSVDPAGMIAIDSQRGPMTVWMARPGDTTFKPGDPVVVRVRTQVFDVLPAGQVAAGVQAPTSPEPAASVGSEPGEYAVITGPATGIDPSGRLTVQSPRGPIAVPVANAAAHRVGDWMEVRTSVHPAR